MKNDDWSHEEIVRLHDYMIEDMSPSKIATRLGRSRNAVMNASKKIMFQQLLHHPPAKVAHSYGMSLSELKNTVVDSKFYVPPYLYCDRLQECTESMSTWLKIWTMTFVSAGLIRYGFVLHQSLTSMSHN